MIEVKVLGAGQEVGRSAFLVDTGVEKFLLDYGLNGQTMATPIEPPVNLDAVFLSHPHLDHIGMVPELYKRGYQGHVFGTKTTLDITTLLLEDSLKVQKLRGHESLFMHHDIDKFYSMYKKVGLGDVLDFPASKVQFKDAGHIPGSAMILIESHGKRILYTGDIKYSDTMLMHGMDKHLKKVDLLITESTYAKRNHPDRELMKKNLREKAKETLQKNGVVLLPSFAVARTQEILMMVYDLGYPVYIDGMGVDVTKIILRNADSIRDPDKLRDAFGVAHKVKKGVQRKEIVRQPCIVIASAGMLQAGPIHNYRQRLHNREDCMIVLTGYQAEDTQGREIMQKKKFTSDGKKYEVKMQVEFLDFSAHIGRDNLLKFIDSVHPEKIIPVHGDSTKEFAHELKQKGYDAHALKNGESLTI